MTQYHTSSSSYVSYCMLAASSAAPCLRRQRVLHVSVHSGSWLHHFMHAIEHRPCRMPGSQPAESQNRPTDTARTAVQVSAVNDIRAVVQHLIHAVCSSWSQLHHLKHLCFQHHWNKCMHAYLYCIYTHIWLHNADLNAYISTQHTHSWLVLLQPLLLPARLMRWEEAEQCERNPHGDKKEFPRIEVWNPELFVLPGVPKSSPTILLTNLPCILLPLNPHLFSL